MALTRDVAGRRYALAIAEIASAAGTWDSWLDAVEALEALTADSSHVAALQSDGMTDERFQAIVREAAGDLAPAQVNLFRLLRRKGRLALGPSVASYFRELMDEERGIARAEVRTAVTMDEESRQRLVEQLSEQTGKTVELTVEVDPALIGGAVVRVGDRLIDGSARRRLRALRDQLVQGGR